MKCIMHGVCHLELKLSGRNKEVAALHSDHRFYCILILCLTFKARFIACTVEPLNDGHIGGWILVLFREVVPI